MESKSVSMNRSSRIMSSMSSYRLVLLGNGKIELIVMCVRACVCVCVYTLQHNLGVCLYLVYCRVVMYIWQQLLRLLSSCYYRVAYCY